MNVDGEGGGGGSAFTNFDRFTAGEISAGEAANNAGAGGDVGTENGGTEGAGPR